MALKMLHSTFGAEETLLQRFRREAELSSEIEHPHIVEVFDFHGGGDAPPLLVMELLEGESLAERIENEGPMDTVRVVRLGREVGSALDVVHSIGVIHRDLKPANVMLVDADGEERAKVVDFGLARLMVGRGYKKLTRTGQIVGTPEFMAPEQLLGRPMDERTDVYSLGALLFTALAGAPPYPGPSAAVQAKVSRAQAPPGLRAAAPLVPPRLCELVERAMATDPSERFASMTELGGALEALSTEPLHSTAEWQPAVPLETLREKVKALPEPVVEPRRGAIATTREASPAPATREISPREDRSTLRRLHLVLLGLAAALSSALVVGAVVLSGSGSEDEVDEPDGGHPVVPAVLPVPAAADAEVEAADASVADAVPDASPPRATSARTGRSGTMGGGRHAEAPASSDLADEAEATPHPVSISITAIDTDDGTLSGSLRRTIRRHESDVERCLADAELPARPFEVVIAFGITRAGYAPAFGGTFPGASYDCFVPLWRARYERSQSGEATAAAEVTVTVQDAASD